MFRRTLAVLALWLPSCGGAAPPPAAPDPADHLTLMALSPAPRSLAAPVGAPLVFTFDRPLRRDSLVLDRTLHVFGRWSGTVRGTLAFQDGDRTAVLTPQQPFAAGEVVTVLVSRDVQAADGAWLRAAGWSAQFWTRAAPAPAVFSETDRLSTRDEDIPRARAYGGIASDLDGDRWLDLAIVNEDTGELVVFRNRAGGTSRFERLTAARYPLGRRASPSEPGDFDRDGRTDIAVANIGDGTVSILLGRGDGTFAPGQTVAVGTTPRGIAALDLDGDADLDLAVANVGSDDVALLRNDGGLFSLLGRAESGAAGEWGLAAADFDEDGVLDLAVGTAQGQRVVVMHNAGDGTLQPLGSQGAGGRVWMLAAGDLDGDRHDDVAAVNGQSNTAALLRGDGRGGLGAAAVHAIDPFALATDLGDLDGDGDLDWVTSSYSGDWRLFENVGGVFTLGREIAPRRAASCALLFDSDRDGDLDLALIDEEADEVVVMRNGS